MINPELLPCAIEAERSVIGGLLALHGFGDSARTVMESLKPSHFHNHANREIYSSICGLVAAGRAADVVTVAEGVNIAGDVAAAGGSAYLVEITNNTPSGHNIKAYADIVIERAIQRQVATEASSLIDMAIGNTEPGELIAHGKQALEQIEIRGGDDDYKSMSIAASEWYLGYAKMLEQGMVGLETGLHNVDERLGKWQPGMLVTIATRPSGGKSLLAGHVVHHCCVKKGFPALFISLEMPARQVFGRLLSREADIPAKSFKQGFTKEENDRCTTALPELQAAPLEIIDRPMTPNQIIQAIRDFRRRNPNLAIAVLDHLLIVRWPGKSQRRDVEIGELTKALKDIAKELDIVVLMLTQMNKQVAQRANKRPVLTDLRDSSSIEDDSDLILLLHAEKNHDPDTPLNNLTEIIAAKVRDDPDAKGTEYVDIINGGFEPVTLESAARRIKDAEPRKEYKKPKQPPAGKAF